jgi:hypothetical protein
LQSEPQKVYNCEVEHEHHFYVGQSGVLAHNACLPDADPASSVQGEEFRAAAEVWWDTLPTPSKFGATVAVSEFEGQQVVSLYANVGSGKYQFSQSQIDAFLESVENAGGMALHASGRVHAEELLHQMHAEAPAIGISNPYGPCDACNVYFQQQAYRNVYWPDE